MGIEEDVNNFHEFLDKIQNKGVEIKEVMKSYQSFFDKYVNNISKQQLSPMLLELQPEVYEQIIGEAMKYAIQNTLKKYQGDTNV